MIQVSEELLGFVSMRLVQVYLFESNTTKNPIMHCEIIIDFTFSIFSVNQRASYETE